jgi:hypothetical protein
MTPTTIGAGITFRGLTNLCKHWMAHRQETLYRHLISGSYAFFNAPKSGPNGPIGYMPLNLVEILQVADYYCADFTGKPNIAQQVSQCLQAMAECKLAKEQTHHAIVRIACRFFDCLNNYWRGIGWITTTALASRICQKLENCGPSSSDKIAINTEATASPTASSTTTTTTATSNSAILLARTAPTQVAPPSGRSTVTIVDTPTATNRRSSSPRIDAFRNRIEQSIQQSYAMPITPPLDGKRNEGNSRKNLAAEFRAAPEKFPINKCKMLFGNLRYTDETDAIQEASPFLSVKGLMCKVSGLSVPDLNNELCAKVIINAFKWTKKEYQDDLSSWLKKQSPPQQLIANCLQMFIDLATEQKTFSLCTVLRLLYFYQSYPQLSNLEIDIITDAICLLPNNIDYLQQKQAMVEWMIAKDYQTLQRLQRLMRSFELKDAQFPHLPPVESELRTLLQREIGKLLGQPNRI